MGKRASPTRAWDATALQEFPASERYLIGVSGGRDSVALLHWLLGLGYRKLVVCHLDHRLRGRSSTADVRFAERLAKAHELEVDVEKIDVRSLAAERKRSIETAARDARYEFFARAARRHRCRAIFLGHHADDMVETFLLNLFRGAGTTGQRGMREVAQRTIGNVELTVIRPLLGVWRREIDEYIAAHRLRYREDATNESLQALRNRMRHRMIPMLENEFGRDIRNAIRRAAVIALDEDAVLNAMLPIPQERLAVNQLRALAPALQRRTIARWLREQQISDVSFDLVEQIRAMLDANTGPAKINLPGDRHARRRAGELFLE